MDVYQEWARLQKKYSLLRHWKLELSGRMRRYLGLAYYDSKTIRLSRAFIEINGEDHPQVIDTLRHEAAHAMAGPGVGHGEVWRMWCKVLGANANRVADPEKSDYEVPDPLWVAHCRCGLIHEKHRLRRGYTYHCRLTRKKLEFVRRAEGGKS